MESWTLRCVPATVLDFGLHLNTTGTASGLMGACVLVCIWMMNKTRVHV